VCAGKKYVCELAAMPVHMLTQEELSTLLLFQVDVYCSVPEQQGFGLPGSGSVVICTDPDLDPSILPANTVIKKTWISTVL
jgi:hypothetical protein